MVDNGRVKVSFFRDNKVTSFFSDSKPIFRFEISLITIQSRFLSSSFFRALNDVAAAPSDLAPRAVAIERGNSLAEAFNSTAVQLEQLKQSTLDRTEEAVESLNTLTKELASVNDRILSASQSGRSPNSLLDLRDKLIGEISKLADITASYSDRGVANVTVGSSGVGPSLVSGNNSTNVGFIERYDKIGGLQIILNPLASKTPTS